MPSTIPGHIYTMVALAVIGSLLVATVNSYTTSLRSMSELEQLRKLLGIAAANGNDLVTLVANTNSSAQSIVQLPASIGTQLYWLRMRNDSSNAWIEGAFGLIVDEAPSHRVYLPKGISTSGEFASGYGPAVFRAYMNGSNLQLNLSSLGG